MVVLEFMSVVWSPWLSWKNCVGEKFTVCKQLNPTPVQALTGMLKNKQK